MGVNCAIFGANKPKNLPSRRLGKTKTRMRASHIARARRLIRSIAVSRNREIRGRDNDLAVYLAIE